MSEQAETLRHRTDLGEVDPRTYFLLGEVKLVCEKVGDSERVSQANRLIHAVDLLCEQEGEPRVRVHLTVAPGGDARKAIEVRLQPLTQQDQPLLNKVKARWPEILTKGEGRWTAA
jgi:hypothetical protein